MAAFSVEFCFYMFSVFPENSLFLLTNAICSFIPEKLHCTSNMYTIQEQEVRKSPAMRLNIQDASLLQGGAENYKSLKSPQLPTAPSQSPDRLLTNNSSDSSGQKSVPISLKTLHAQDTAPLLSASDKYLPKSPSELSSKQNSSCSKPQTNFEKLPLSVESVPNPNVKTSQMQVGIFIFSLYLSFFVVFCGNCPDEPSSLVPRSQ